MTGSGDTAANRALRHVRDLPIATRILLVVIGSVVLAAAAAVTALVQLDRSDARTHAMYADNLNDISMLSTMSEEMRDARLALFAMALSTDPKAIDTQHKALTAIDAQLDAQFAKFRETTAAPQALDALVKSWTRYREIRDGQLVPLAASGDPANQAEFNAIRAKNAAVAGDLLTQMAKLTKAELEQAAAMDAASKRANRNAIVLVVTILVLGVASALLFSLTLARSITVTARRVSELASALREGDLSRCSGVRSRDELGRMAADLDEATATLRSTIREVAASAGGLAASAEQLSGVTDEMSGEAARSSEQAGLVAAGSAQVGANVQNLAGATEEMSASIREIASNAENAARTAQEAGTEVERIQNTISTLGESSARIGTVVNLISSIAEQTNLLALNATIEAARAGEAGKGFAVVAGEVKDLANQTAKATTEISEQVETIQRDVSASVEAISRIVGTVAEINAIQTTIAGAVEEQTATTMDISRSVQEAAQGSSDISETISRVAEAATTTTAGVAEIHAATGDLAKTASDLRRLTSTFRY